MRASHLPAAPRPASAHPPRRSQCSPDLQGSFSEKKAQSFAAALTRRDATLLLDKVERSVHHIRRDEVADAALLLREDRRRAIVLVHQVDHGHVVVQGLVRLEIIRQDELARAAQDSEGQRGDQPYLDSIKSESSAEA